MSCHCRVALAIISSSSKHARRPACHTLRRQSRPVGHRSVGSRVIATFDSVSLTSSALDSVCTHATRRHTSERRTTKEGTHTQSETNIIIQSDRILDIKRIANIGARPPAALCWTSGYTAERRAESSVCPPLPSRRIRSTCTCTKQMASHRQYINIASTEGGSAIIPRHLHLLHLTSRWRSDYTRSANADGDTPHSCQLSKLSRCHIHARWFQQNDVATISFLAIFGCAGNFVVAPNNSWTRLTATDVFKHATECIFEHRTVGTECGSVAWSASANPTGATSCADFSDGEVTIRGIEFVAGGPQCLTAL